MESPRRKSGHPDERIQKPVYVHFLGCFGAILAGSVYPLLDRRPLTLLVVLLFLLPFAVHISLAIRRRLPANIRRSRQVFIACGGTLIGLAAFLGLNGLLDRAPAQVVRTPILHKHVTVGRGASVGRFLDVSSWRREHDEEHLQVGSAQYRSSAIGDLIVIEIHGGRFGVPWYGSIGR